MLENRNTILAVILSGLVLVAWQYFYNIPQMEKQRAAQQAQAELQKKAATQAGDAASSSTTPQAGSNAPAPSSPSAAAPSPTTAPTVDRAAAIEATPRVKIDTPKIAGSISLKGARIDDISLLKFRETVDPKSPPIVLFSPSGSPNPYYAEFGWVGAAGSIVRLPDQNTVWQQESTGALTPASPLVLK